jgi:nucleoside 2-deoxyribosyltransferase
VILLKTIYVAHYTKYDFEKELYEPLKKITNYEFIFPHDKSIVPESSKNKIKKCDAILAEVSYPSTGTGIEIGWADSFKKPIIFISKKGIVVSKSLNILSNNFFEYKDLNKEYIKLKKYLDKVIK